MSGLLRAAMAELLRLEGLPGGMTENLGEWQTAWDQARTAAGVMVDKTEGGMASQAPSITDAQIEAVRQWFIEKHACWFTTASLREMFAVAGVASQAHMDGVLVVGVPSVTRGKDGL